jgi:hypothetical protein
VHDISTPNWIFGASLSSEAITNSCLSFNLSINLIVELLQNHPCLQWIQNAFQAHISDDQFLWTNDNNKRQFFPWKYATFPKWPFLPNIINQTLTKVMKNSSKKFLTGYQSIPQLLA